MLAVKLRSFGDYEDEIVQSITVGVSTIQYIAFIVYLNAKNCLTELK
jgi:hypothetical protein